MYIYIYICICICCISIYIHTHDALYNSYIRYYIHICHIWIEEEVHLVISYCYNCCLSSCLCFSVRRSIMIIIIMYANVDLDCMYVCMYVSLSLSRYLLHMYI